MDEYEKICQAAVDTLLDMISSGKFKSRDDIHAGYELVDIIKDMYCIWDYEDKSDDGYSEYGGGHYPNRGMTYDDTSYARRRSSYNRNGGNMMSRRGGSSYHSSKKEYIDELYSLMDKAPDEQTRQKIQRMIQEMEQG